MSSRNGLGNFNWYFVGDVSDVPLYLYENKKPPLPKGRGTALAVEGFEFVRERNDTQVVPYGKFEFVCKRNDTQVVPYGTSVTLDPIRCFICTDLQWLLSEI